MISSIEDGAADGGHVELELVVEEKKNSPHAFVVSNLKYLLLHSTRAIAIADYHSRPVDATAL